MDKKELAEFIHSQIVEAGNYWKMMFILKPYLSDDDYLGQGLISIYLSLQQSFFITMFKIFDTGKKDAREKNIYSLVEKDDKKTIDKYKKIIAKIKEHRNKIYAHNTSENPKLAQDEVEQFEDLLKCIAEVCSHYSNCLFPNYYTKNIESLDKFLKYYVDKKVVSI